MAEERLLRFTLGRETFALRLDDAGSLVNLPGRSRVPLAPREIGGVADVRGRVVTLVRLTRLADLPDDAGPSRRALLLAPPRGHIGLEVDHDVENGAGGEELPFRGLLTAEGVLLNLIDPEALADACQRRVLQRFRRTA